MSDLEVLRRLRAERTAQQAEQPLPSSGDQRAESAPSADSVGPKGQERRTQAVADAFEALAVLYHALPAARCSTSPPEAAALWERMTETASWEHRQPFEQSLVEFTRLCESHFARHLVRVCRDRGIRLTVVQPEGEMEVLSAYPADGKPLPHDLVRAIKVLHGPLMAVLANPEHPLRMTPA